MNACDARIWKVDVGGSRIGGQPGLHILTQKTKPTKQTKHKAKENKYSEIVSIVIWLSLPLDKIK